MNLISNAAEAMPDGGKVHIITENFYSDTHTPSLPVLKRGEYVKLIVKDEGIGIADEDKEKIFEPFYTKKTLGRSGSGLGMAMVWGAVQDHDGYIDIQSAPEKGTVISIYFPAIQTPSPLEQKSISLDQFRGNGETILVVDDLEDQRELASELLTHLGYIVKTVPSGEAAVAHIKNHPADLIILDMIMHPGMDGLDTYKEIIKHYPHQKAVIATGFSTSKRIQTAQSLGAGPCLKKPYLLQDMARIVREELDR
jgi:two-component system, cell cycle sensor histidine kinase and response regulator CckA